MSETVKRRRRWPCMVLIAVLLLVGGPIAWRYRPLTPTEFTLLGTWTFEDDGAQYEITLTPDRRFVEQTTTYTRDADGNFRAATWSGSWSASGSTLFFCQDFREPLRWDTVFVRLRQMADGRHRIRKQIEFDQQGRLLQYHSDGLALEATYDHVSSISHSEGGRQ